VLDVAAVAADVFAARQRAGVAVADVDRVALGDPTQVRDDAAVDHVAFFMRNRRRDRDDFAWRVLELGRARAGLGGRDEENADEQRAGEGEKGGETGAVAVEFESPAHPAAIGAMPGFLNPLRRLGSFSQASLRHGNAQSSSGAG
jgi:hypothetical protein